MKKLIALAFLILTLTARSSEAGFGLPGMPGLLKPVIAATGSCEFQVVSGERQIPSGQVQIGC